MHLSLVLRTSKRLIVRSSKRRRAKRPRVVQRRESSVRRSSRCCGQTTCSQTNIGESQNRCGGRRQTGCHNMFRTRLTDRHASTFAASIIHTFRPQVRTAVCVRRRARLLACVLVQVWCPHSFSVSPHLRRRRSDLSRLRAGLRAANSLPKVRLSQPLRVPLPLQRIRACDIRGSPHARASLQQCSVPCAWLCLALLWTGSTFYSLLPCMTPSK